MKRPGDSPDGELAAIRLVRVCRAAVEVVHEHLQMAGRNGHEGLGFWAGTLTSTIAQVEAGVVPGQLSGRVGRGLAIVVGGEELFKMNVWLYEHSYRLIAQIHSHPSLAYHSETDDSYATIAEVGGLSIVVPNFAKGPFNLDECAVYRLAKNGMWVELAPEQARTLIEIED